MKKQFLVLVFSFLVFIVSVSMGQYYELTRYADNDGLSSRIIRGTFQDNKGFLWIAGSNGLFRFDTQQFKSFYAPLKNTTGLRGNKIIAITQTTDDKIWVGVDKGLHYLENDEIVYKQLLNNPTDEQNYILSLFEDKDQNLWIGTYGGLFVIEKSTEEIIFISETNKIIPKSAVWGIAQDENGRILFASKNNLFISNKKESFTFQKLKIDYTNGLELNGIKIFKLQEFNDGLFLLSTNSGLLKGVLINDTNLTISEFIDETGTSEAKYFIEDFIIDSDKNVWIATWRNYFKKYKIINNELVEHDVFINNGLAKMSADVLSVYEDSQKNIWLSNSNGLFKLSEERGDIFIFPPNHIKDCFNNDFNITALIEDKGKYLWIANTIGLYRFNKSDILQRKCPTDYLLLENDNFKSIHNLFIDSQRRLWVTSKAGISIAQLDSNSSPEKFLNITKKDGLPHNWSFEVYEEDENNYWVGNYIRLLKLTFKNEELKNPVIKSYDSSRDRPDALVNSYTTNIQQDENNNIWIGTFNGVSKLVSEKGNGTFVNYTSSFGNYNCISNNSIKKIFLDKSNRLWIGTQTGLNLYREETGDFYQFGRTDGLPSEYILGLDEDTKGFLWVSTTNGIMKTIYDDTINIFTKIKYYSTKDGLADNITNINAVLIDTEDNVFVGSSKGLSVFPNSSKKLSTDKKIFNVVLTSIKTTQQEKQGFVSVKNRIEDSTLDLEHFENSIQLRYAALDFTNYKYNKYRHKFLPINKNWIETGNSSELTYYNVSPGKYELILDGCNNDGTWTSKPIHLSVIISPPFWKSNFAYVFYVFLIIGILRLFHILKIRKKRRELTQEINHKKALLEEREQLRQENAADFHDELGSKVTKVSLFLTLAERSLKNREDPTQWLSKIRRNTIEISDTFRDLLWVIDPKKDTLSDTLLRLKDFGENLFNNTGIEFRTTGFSLDKNNYMFDAQTKKQVVLIFKEAMNNCVKYAKCKTVRLNLQTTELYSIIELSDDGKGFDTDCEKDNKGRGLKNMINRAKKMNANLSISSTMNKGTKICLSNIPHMVDDFSTVDA